MIGKIYKIGFVDIDRLIGDGLSDIVEYEISKVTEGIRELFKQYTIEYINVSLFPPFKPEYITERRYMVDIVLLYDINKKNKDLMLYGEYELFNDNEVVPFDSGWSVDGDRIVGQVDWTCYEIMD